MQLKRVVITGMGAVSSYGVGIDPLWTGLSNGRSGIARVPGLEEMDGLRPRIGGIVPAIDAKQIPRQKRRSMSPMSIFATFAAQQALLQGEADTETFAPERLGLVLGSTTGGPAALEDFFRSYFRDGGISSIKSTHFFKVMNHSAASNVGQALGLHGQVVAPSAACATGSQAVIQGYEAVAYGKQDAVLCGGTEEFHPLTVGTFDIMEAASYHRNDEPQFASRPFDANRDGVVCSEGCGMLLLESLESAEQRGAAILAEVAGTGMTFDPSSVANPDPMAIRRCMELAFESADISADAIGYVNAHATSTFAGDRAEAVAVKDLFGGDTPVSSYKGYMGHTMAASGVLETIISILSVREERLLPNMNLEEVAEGCEGIHLPTETSALQTEFWIKNSFGLGGINTSLVLRSID
nr:beta-ketoacyl-[acyl-carrier-protein] synthase family protein [Pseudodesulfovibrio sp.]